ncbi:MAG: hypothetical protein EXR64_03815 [Dehalococcoidia bacterium]|nr:hypothetical protein [Dehalococcoidia bacterium]
MDRIPPVLRSLLFGALFAAFALAITTLLRASVGGPLLQSGLTPLVILVLLEVVWAVVTLRGRR